MKSKEQYQDDARNLREAMKGWGTNEDKIIEITAYRKNIERQEILKQYKSMYGRDALEDLDDELGGNFCKTILAMYMPPAMYDATQLHQAIEGAGTDEDILIEIIATRTNEQLNDIRNEYKRLFKADLEKDVIGDTSGFFKNLLVALVQGNRDTTSDIDILKLHKDIQALYNAGVAKLGTDEETFLRIFSLRSNFELKYIASEYLKSTGKSIFTVIDDEFSGNLKRLLHTILLGHINPPDYFAQRIRSACEGIGTKDSLLIRVLVSRDEIDLKEIKQIYLRNYKKTLNQEVEDETSGDYKKILLALIASD